ncbi:hypothetical protein WR25_05775 [Diploscapter pachys]|uniref:Gamma-glutamylcyclotransferase family protein n=1 Tax=Diploscapter pachys TaxID=2018661 RepID=A0A2A2M0T8_9BILA|nr:hypothetical protein WR25_05775 [Diploscapter pachys]
MNLIKRIEGEVYEVDQEKLMILDDLEAYPTLYDRKVEMIELKGRNEHVEAYMYLLRKWNEKIFEGATEMLESYTSLGPHGRPYVDRYLRASQMLDDKEGYDLYSEVLGQHATQLQTRLLTKQKAQHDLNDSTAKQL